MRDEGYYNHFRHLYDDSAHQLRSLQPEKAIAHVVDLYVPAEVQESPYTPEREVMDGGSDGGDADADASSTQQMRLRGALAVQTAAKNAASVGLGRALEGDLKGGDWRNQLSTSATELDQVTALLPQWLRKSPLLLDTDLREDLLQYEEEGSGGDSEEKQERDFEFRDIKRRHEESEARKSVQGVLARAKGFLPTDDDDDSGAFTEPELDGDADGSAGLPSYKMIMSEDPDDLSAAAAGLVVLSPCG